MGWAKEETLTTLASSLERKRLLRWLEAFATSLDAQQSRNLTTGNSLSTHPS